MEFDVSTSLALEQVIRSMNPEWSRLSVLAEVKRGPRSYVINVHGQGQHHCMNKSGAHGHSKIYFTVTPNGVAQKCPYRSESSEDCACYRSARVPHSVSIAGRALPYEFCLFPESGGGPGDG